MCHACGISGSCDPAPLARVVHSRASMKKTLFAIVSLLFIGCGESHSIESTEAALGSREYNAAMDLLIRTFGDDGRTACSADATGATDCLSYSAKRPRAVSVGDDHASQSQFYQCSSNGGALQDCVLAYAGPVDCQETCMCGGAGLDGILDCAEMINFCKDGTLECANGEGSVMYCICEEN